MRAKCDVACRTCELACMAGSYRCQSSRFNEGLNRASTTNAATFNRSRGGLLQVRFCYATARVTRFGSATP